uniref:Uncharacterized protein n=1 Tax=Candidatus Kentrum sp. DK TaxID=2126562 RepID=A0A450SXZ7_9GAMM|nr:MAG: hypothetical protein BECKDK2373B_GA0170837_10802 [Candidatus Kentron sp. DK]
MGLFVHLTINPEGISPGEWEATYLESLTLLRAFPAPLMRIKQEEVGSKSRFSYISDLVWDADTPDEHWRVVGDSASGRHAEDFLLFRHLERQFRTMFGPLDIEGDVLWAPTDRLSYGDGNGINLFGNKTQGYPYHLAILAVAILLETRFPEQCYLSGDIEPVQLGHMCRWVHKTLNTPLITPICFDGQRLYRRISALYEDPRHAISRFQTLFGGSDEEGFESLLRYAERSAVLDVFIEELAGYTSLTQYGAIQLVSKFLSATQDLDQLIHIVLQIAQKGDKGDKSEEWDLAALLRMLCRHYLTISCEERGPLGVFDHPQDELMTIDDALSQAFMIAGGKPLEVNAYKDAAKVLETFCAVQPEKRALFQEIISTSEQTAREQLEKTKNLIREMEQKRQESAQQQGQTTAETLPLMENHSEKAVSEEEAYILKQVSLQTEQFADKEETLGQIGGQLRRIAMADNAELFSAKDRDYYLQGIYDATFHHRFALREAAWNAIDREENVEILKCLLALAIIKKNELNFWRWRIHVLESPSIWRYLIEERQVDAGADDNGAE